MVASARAVFCYGVPTLVPVLDHAAHEPTEFPSEGGQAQHPQRRRHVGLGEGRGGIVALALAVRVELLLHSLLERYVDGHFTLHMSVRGRFLPPHSASLKV